VPFLQQAKAGARARDLLPVALVSKTAVFEKLVTGSRLHGQPHCSKPLYETRVVGFDVACTDVRGRLFGHMTGAGVRARAPQCAKCSRRCLTTRQDVSMTKTDSAGVFSQPPEAVDATAGRSADSNTSRTEVILMNSRQD
jgi:hypothetical protein